MTKRNTNKKWKSKFIGEKSVIAKKQEGFTNIFNNVSLF